MSNIKLPYRSVRRFTRNAILASAAIACIGAINFGVIGSTLAVDTKYFTHSTATDFGSGELEGISVTTYGELKLARKLDPILGDGDTSLADAAQVVESLAVGRDGTIFVGTSLQGHLLGIKDAKLTTIASFGDATSVSAMLVDGDGTLYFTTSGPEAKLHALKPGEEKPEEIGAIDNAQYVWSIVDAGNGTLYLGTGPNGILVEAKPAQKAFRPVVDLEESNLLSLAFDGKQTLFVGTDPNGLIYKVDRTTGKSFVLYDAAEAEVGTLLLDPKGNLYVGTTQFVEGTETGLTIENTKTGRPSGATDVGDEVDHDAPDMPTPPAPLPLEPDAIAHAAPDAADAGDADHANVADGEANAEDHKADDVAESDESPSPSGPTVVTGTSGASTAGNAVYRIDPSGFVTEIYRGPVMVLDLALQNEQLLIACGATGELIQLDTSNEESTVIVDLDQPHITALLPNPDGTLTLGVAAPASVHKLGATLAGEGTFTSPVLDAAQISSFGNFRLQGTAPVETSIKLSVRSSNIEDADNPAWSEWSPAKPITRFTPIDVPAARFLQYRLTLRGNGKTGPSVDSISIAYQWPNLSPRISAVTVSEPELPVLGTEPTASPVRTIGWEAADPNEDALRARVSIRPVGGAWVLVEADLDSTSFDLDTRRFVDGRYEAKVEVSDAPGNIPADTKSASRVSEVFTIDNTAPVIGDVAVKYEADRAIITLRVADRTGIVRGLEFLTEGQKGWQRALPSDRLNDSPEEQYTIVLPLPAEATRVVSLRAIDNVGNAAHTSVTLKR